MTSFPPDAVFAPFPISPTESYKKGFSSGCVSSAAQWKETKERMEGQSHRTIQSGLSPCKQPGCDFLSARNRPSRIHVRAPMEDAETGSLKGGSSRFCAAIGNAGVVAAGVGLQGLLKVTHLNSPSFPPSFPPFTKSPRRNCFGNVERRHRRAYLLHAVRENAPVGGDHRRGPVGADIEIRHERDRYRLKFRKKWPQTR